MSHTPVKAAGQPPWLAAERRMQTRARAARLAELSARTGLTEEQILGFATKSMQSVEEVMDRLDSYHVPRRSSTGWSDTEILRHVLLVAYKLCCLGELPFPPEPQQ